MLQRNIRPWGSLEHAHMWFRSKASGRLALALQGGGAHGAFTWGVLDTLLEDGSIDIEGVSATSAGTMNAAVLAHGLLQNGRDGARECHLSP